VAVLADRMDEVQRLLAADPGLLRATTDVGETPLKLAERYGRARLVEWLRSAAGE
jgi:hypothetical protein